MKKKGFTLIELLAVIIILAVIALIATPIVLNVVENARRQANKNSVYGIMDSAKLYYTESLLDTSKKNNINGTTNLINEISISGKRPESGVLYINNKGETALAVVYGEVCYKKNFTETDLTETEDTDNCTIDVGTQVTPTPTYEAYSVGDDVTLTDGTTWVVVKDTTTSESEIKLMSTSNIHPDLTDQTGTAMFLSESTGGYELAYDDDSNVWANSTLKAYLDGTVKSSLETSLNTTISDITIWGAEELTALGCTVTGNDTDGYRYSAVSCDNTKAWYSKVFEDTYSWTKLPSAGTSSDALIVREFGDFVDLDVNLGDFSGARPVITVSKSVISQ